MRNSQKKCLKNVFLLKHLVLLHEITLYMPDNRKPSRSGLYIHVPFCKSRCIYCGFYSTVGTRLRQDYVDALCEEIRLRGPLRPITVYIGGGTPSQLSFAQLEQLFRCMDEVYGAAWQHPDGHPIEITMECNPDDVTEGFTAHLSTLPVNRVSLGIQTFNNERLRFLRRRHTASEAMEAVRRLRGAGFRNISIDLMFGFPDETLDEWMEDIEQALSLHVDHLSAYSLMYEEGTPLHQLLVKRQVSEIEEELYIRMYDVLVDRLKTHGYHHYEISNFAHEGMHSRHNSLYWDDVPYVGLGASAHSYDGQRRQWNVADVRQYITSISQGKIPSEYETIDLQTHYNDMITTRLRTCTGIDIEDMRRTFGDHLYHYLLQNADTMVREGYLKMEEGRLRLTLAGIHVSDMVMSELIYI